jgi:TRAP-type C4-dicarboxylate transport system permease small subunit
VKAITELRNAVRKLNDWLYYFSCLAFVIILLYVVCHILGRLIFNAPAKGITDIVGLFSAVSFGFCVSWVEKEGGHIRVDFIAELFPGKTQRIIMAAMECLGILVVGIIAWRFCIYAMGTFSNGNTTSTVYWKYWPFAFCVFIGFVMYFITALVNFIYKIACWQQGITPEEQKEVPLV